MKEDRENEPLDSETSPQGRASAAGASETPAGSSGRRRREGARGRATRRLRPERPCLNCGDPTVGAYCATCGQKKAEVLVSLRVMVADALEDEFVLNRRLPKTLVNLFFRPGFLTVEHLNGRIARYVGPFRLYLVSSVIFFLLLSFFSLRVLARAEIGQNSGTAATSDTMSIASVDSALAEIETSMADEELAATGALGLGQARTALERQRERTLAARQGEAVSGDEAVGTVEGGGLQDTGAVTAPRSDTVAASAGAAAERDRPQTLGELIRSNGNNVQFEVSTGSETLNQAARRRIATLLEMTPRQAIERLVSDFLNYIPTMMFVLLPLFALVLKLLYVRRGRFYVEHFVFLLHTHAFIYLLFTVMLVLRGTLSLPSWLFLTLVTWASVYLFVAMKRVYGQGWLITFVKGWVLGWVYVVALVLSIPVALVASLLLH